MKNEYSVRGHIKYHIMGYLIFRAHFTLLIIIDYLKLTTHFYVIFKLILALQLKQISNNKYVLNKTLL